MGQMTDTLGKKCYVGCSQELIDLGKCDCHNRVISVTNISDQDVSEYYAPTVHLRFRQEFEQKILQQMWQGSQGTQEWRDVPIKKITL